MYKCENCGNNTRGRDDQIKLVDDYDRTIAYVDTMVCRECGAILEIDPQHRPYLQGVLQYLPSSLRDKVHISDSCQELQG